MLIDGDEFIEKPAETLNSVEKFLNIPKFFSKQIFDHYVKENIYRCGDFLYLVL